MYKGAFRSIWACPESGLESAAAMRARARSVGERLSLVFKLVMALRLRSTGSLILEATRLEESRVSAAPTRGRASSGARAFSKARLLSSRCVCASNKLEKNDEVRLAAKSLSTRAKRSLDREGRALVLGSESSSACCTAATLTLRPSRRS